MSALRVVVVDDSSIFRMLVSSAFSGISGVSIVGRCKNGREAIAAIREHHPDLVTMDVEMPEMDGLTALREIRRLGRTEVAFSKVKVVMLSSVTREGADTTIQALGEGALDCIPKPAEGDADKNQALLVEHLHRVVSMVLETKEARKSRLQHAQDSAIPSSKEVSLTPREAIKSASRSAAWPEAEALAIGISTGGPMALNVALPGLCEKTHLPIFVVQHMPAGFTASLADSLNRKCRHTVVEGAEGMMVQPNHVYIAPGGKHMTVTVRDGRKVIALNDFPPENGCRPAVDVLFRSLADVYGGKLVVAVMTGMGSDGAKGLMPLAQQGARVVAQDQASSVVWGMPGSAVATGFVHEIAPLEKIAETMVGLISRKI